VPAFLIVLIVSYGLFLVTSSFIAWIIFLGVLLLAFWAATGTPAPFGQAP
jgi:hypothetical protein